MVVVLVVLGALLVLVVGSPAVVFAAWAPLLTSADFTGISADVSTAVAGIIGIVLIIMGAAMLMKALR